MKPYKQFININHDPIDHMPNERSIASLAGNNLASDNTTANGFTTKYFTTYLGTSSGEEGRGIASDSNQKIFLTGGTYGGLNSNNNSGGQDIFLVKNSCRKQVISIRAEHYGIRHVIFNQLKAHQTVINIFKVGPGKIDHINF